MNLNLDDQKLVRAIRCDQLVRSVEITAIELVMS